MSSSNLERRPPGARRPSSRNHAWSRRLRLPVALFCISAIGGTLRAQVQESWTSIFSVGTQRKDIAQAVAFAPNGELHVAGGSDTSAGPLVPHHSGLATVTYDAAGNESWSAVLDEPPGSSIRFEGMALSHQGDTYLLGQSSTSGLTLIKYAPNGSLSWSRSFPDLLDNLYDPTGPVLVDGAGDIFIGAEQTISPGVYGQCIRKLDPAGNVVWSTAYTFGTSNGGTIEALALASNGDILATGIAAPAGATSGMVSLMRVDAAGNFVWGSTAGGPAGLNALGRDVAVDAAGNAYVAGVLDVDMLQTHGDRAVLSWDPNGVLRWTRDIDLGATTYNELNRVAIDRFGRIVAAGYVMSPTQEIHFSTVVLDAAGNSIWERTWAATAQSSELEADMAVDASGNIIVAGWSAPSGAAPVMPALIAYDPVGDLRFAYVKPLTAGPASDQFLAVAVGSANTIAAAGSRATNGDFLTELLQRTAVPICFGDGSGTACPCGNSSAPVEQSGCTSSLGIGGRLIDSGASSLSADTFVLEGSHMPNSPVLYFQGTVATGGGAGALFGDGLRCASGTVVRLGTKMNVGGASQYPSAGDLPVSVRGGVSTIGVRTYQAWYRNAATFCTSATFNLTNGLSVDWVP